MKPLTKSLHTVTATVNVARMLVRLDACAEFVDAHEVARAALAVLGYDIDAFSADDPTLAAIIKQIGKL